MGSDREQAVLPAAEERELVSSLAKLALERAAPEELALFPETADEYFRDPEAALHPRQRDEAVGFGLELAMLTPYLLAVVKYVVRMLAEVVEESVEEEFRPSIGRRVHRLFRGGEGARTGPGGPAPLTPEQMRRVRAAAFERGMGLGLDEPRAALLADSVVGGLVMG